MTTMLIWLGLMCVWVWPRYSALALVVVLLVAAQVAVNWALLSGFTFFGLWPSDIAAPTWRNMAIRMAKTVAWLVVLGIPVVAMRKYGEKHAYKEPPRAPKRGKQPGS
jgi:hypothetical protein